LRAILKIEALISVLKSQGVEQTTLSNLLALYRDVYAEAYSDGQTDLKEELELDDDYDE
jgi:hypothetical protein